MAEKTRSNPKTTAAVSQIVGNAGARYVAGQARMGAERLAAHEKAISQINRLRKGATAAHNNAVAWQNQKLANIRKGYNSSLSGADRAVQRARAELRQYNEDVETVARRAAKGRTNTLLRDNARAISQTREAHSRAISRIDSLKRFNAITGGVPERYVAPHREAARGLRDAMTFNVAERRQLSWSSPAREAAEIKANTTKMMRSAHARDLRQAVFNAESTRDLIASRMNDSMRETVLHARNAAADIQSRFGSAAARAMEKAGPKASSLQRTLARAASSGQPLASSAKSLITLGGTFASNAEIASRLAAGGKTSKVLQVAGKIAKTAAFPVTGPAKAIAGLFNSVEKAGSIVAGSGVGGKAIRAVTKAGGLAGGFAMGSWIDAGLNYAQFKAEGHSLSDVGKKTVDTVEGHQVVRKNPGWWDVTLGNSKYWREVLKGAARALTFGFAGNGEAGQGLFESDAEFAERKKRESDPDGQEARWLKGYDVQTGKPLVDRDTWEDISAEVAKVRQATLYQAKERTLQAQLIGAFDPRIKYSQQTKAELRGRFQGFNPDNLDFETYAAMIDTLGVRRQKALEEMESNVANFERFAAAQPERVRRHLTTAEAYRGYRTKAIEKEYSENMGHMLANKKLAGELADHRRDALYLGVTGRNYRDDVNAQLKGEDDTFFREFNKEWGGMSLEARALYDVGKELKEYEAAGAPKEPVPPAPAKKEGE